MQDWLKQNGLQLAIIAAATILAWGTFNVRLNNIEAKVSQYPSQDWFTLKFENISDRMDELEESLDNHSAEVNK